MIMTADELERRMEASFSNGRGLITRYVAQAKILRDAIVALRAAEADLLKASLRAPAAAPAPGGEREP